MALPPPIFASRDQAILRMQEMIENFFECHRQYLGALNGDDGADSMFKERMLLCQQSDPRLKRKRSGRSASSPPLPP